MPAASRDNLRRFAARVTELDNKELQLLAALAEVRAELDRLEALVEPYLPLLAEESHAAATAGTGLPGEVPQPPQPPSENPPPGSRAVPEITAREIREKAKQVLEVAGANGLKAIQIAKQIIPTYDFESDKRAFENRVYSVLKRDNEFTRSSRGHWVLAEYAEQAEFDMDRNGHDAAFRSPAQVLGD